MHYTQCTAESDRNVINFAGHEKVFDKLRFELDDGAMKLNSFKSACKHTARVVAWPLILKVIFAL